jgi:O-antigen ligase
MFLLVWQSIVPTPVRERVMMTKTSDGQLEASAEERVELWDHAVKAFSSSPIVGTGYATFQLGEHVDELKDTHNWYVKVLVETGIIGMLIVLFLLQQLLALAYRLFKRSSDPLYRGLGLGLLLASCACLVANFFGDRWTYVEITGLLWALTGTALRATKLMESEAGYSPERADSEGAAVSNMAYR